MLFVIYLFISICIISILCWYIPNMFSQKFIRIGMASIYLDIALLYRCYCYCAGTFCTVIIATPFCFRVKLGLSMRHCFHSTLIFFFDRLQFSIFRIFSYSEGYCCDLCNATSTSGPFFHCDDPQEDYCVPCATEKGLSLFDGLVSTLYFASSSESLYDNETVSPALFAYRLTLSTYGIYFACGSNLLFEMQKDTAEQLRYYNSNCAELTSLNQKSAYERFPWIFSEFHESFDRKIQLHPTPNSPHPKSSFLFIESVLSDPNGLRIKLCNNITQICDNRTGCEYVTLGQHLISFFDSHKPLFCPKRVAQERVNEYVEQTIKET
eukprot:gene9583-6738_t